MSLLPKSIHRCRRYPTKFNSGRDIPNAINKDVSVHTKVSLNVRHRVVSPAHIAERTASLEIRLKL